MMISIIPEGHAYEYYLGKNDGLKIDLKGEANYAFRVRTNYRDAHCI